MTSMCRCHDRRCGQSVFKQCAVGPARVRTSQLSRSRGASRRQNCSPYRREVMETPCWRGSRWIRHDRPAQDRRPSMPDRAKASRHHDMISCIEMPERTSFAATHIEDGARIAPAGFSRRRLKMLSTRRRIVTSSPMASASPRASSVMDFHQFKNDGGRQFDVGMAVSEIACAPVIGRRPAPPRHRPASNRPCDIVDRGFGVRGERMLSLESRAGSVRRDLASAFSIS